VTRKKPASIRTPIAVDSGTGAIADKASAKACLAIRAPLAPVPWKNRRRFLPGRLDHNGRAGLSALTASPAIPDGRPGRPTGPGRPVQIFRGYQWVEVPLGTGAGAFLLASIARFLYPIVCLACDRPRP
jgi:hypothetical protein